MLLAQRQRGQAALITILLLLGAGTALFVYALATPVSLSAENDRRNAAVLAQARDALIGYAARDSNRPGSLPCPDTNNDGSVETFSGSDCQGYVSGSNVYLGRLPWRTLGLPDLRDAAGERLWYAVSRNFARNPVGAPALNSDTAGQLTVTGEASGVIAIVFSPGVAVGSQNRATGENLAPNYLEGGNQNGGSTAIFFRSAAPPFNDRLLSITRDALFPVVEMRVARELRQSLLTYYTANSYYPFAAPLTGTAWVNGIYRGRVPTLTCNPLPSLSLPSWFTTNNWHQVMIYAVAPRCTPLITLTGTVISLSGTCTGCTPWFFGGWLCPTYSISLPSLNCANTIAGPYLTIEGSATYHAAVLPAGYGYSTQTRPCTTIENCLEAVGANTENIDTPDNYIYVKPIRSSTNNDNLIIVAP
jgi:hypothetical protein